MADLVLWDPAFFGVKPELVIKKGAVALGADGDANASIPTPQPILPRPMFGASPTVAADLGVNFVVPVALEDGQPERLALRREFVAVENVRAAARPTCPSTTRSPEIKVDPDTFTVTIDGNVVEQAPVAELPLAQRYFLF